MTIAWNEYTSTGFYDELMGNKGHVRKPAQKLVSCLKALSHHDIAARKIAAELNIKEMGVSFTVYTEEGNIDRAMGFLAQYVSGYIETLPAPGKVKLVGSDASHAWISVYSPTEGWVEFDPTNNCVASDQHIITPGDAIILM